MDELNDAKACILRELQEEIRITEDSLQNLCLRYITLRLINGEVRQNYYFFAELNEKVDIELKCDEGLLEWIPLYDINSLDMPITAKFVLRHYLEFGKDTTLLYGGCTKESGVVFTGLEEF